MPQIPAERPEHTVNTLDELKKKIIIATKMYIFWDSIGNWMLTHSWKFKNPLPLASNHCQFIYVLIFNDLWLKIFCPAYWNSKGINCWLLLPSPRQCPLATLQIVGWVESSRSDQTKSPRGKANILPTNTSQQKPTADTWPGLSTTGAQGENVLYYFLERKQEK